MRNLYAGEEATVRTGYRTIRSDQIRSVTQLFLKKCLVTSLVAQWLRICLSRQGTQVQSLVRKIPHAAEQLSPWAATKTANSMRGPPTIARVAPIHCDQRELTGSNEDPVSP